MSFAECILNGVEEGVIKESQAQRAQDLFQKELDAAAGDELDAARKAFAQLKRETARKRHIAILKVKAFKRLQKEMGEFVPAIDQITLRGFKDIPRPAKYMQSVVDFGEGKTEFVRNLDGTYKNVFNNAMAQFDEGLTRNRQQLLGRKGKADNRSLLFEVFGTDTGNAAARIVAQQWKDVSEYLRLRANRAGMAIAQRFDYGLPQKHDGVLVGNVKVDEWVDSIIDDLDLERMINEETGLPFSKEQLRIELFGVYESITMDGLNKVKPGQTGAVGSLANRRQDHRFLVFKNPEAWLKYQERFGDPDVYQTMMGHIESMSRDIALLEVLGPNPNTTIEALKVEALKIAKKFDRGTGKTRAQDLYSGDINMFEDMYNTFTRNALIPASVRLANYSSMLRNLLTASSLGSVTPIAVPTDMMSSRITARMMGLPVTKLMVRMFSQTIDGMTKTEKTQFGVRLGLAADNWISNAHAQARYLGEVLGPKKSVVLSDFVLRSSALSGWTQGARQALGIEFLGALGGSKNKKFAQLDKNLRSTMKKYGINEQKWDIIRSTEMETVKGVDFVRPLNIQNRTDINASLRDEIGVQLTNIIHNETNRAVPGATIRSRATIFGVQKRGTVGGELTESAKQFKSFPIAIMQGNLLRYLTLDAGFFTKVRWGIDFLTTMTFAGALGMQARQLVANKDPQNMNDLKFWGAAFLYGGGGSILSDFIFSDLNRFGGGLKDTLMGPSLDAVDRFRDLTVGNAMQAAVGERTNAASETITYLQRLMPGQNIWFLRGAIERYGFDQLRLWMQDDAQLYFLRREAKRYRERGQASWWRQGEMLPYRWPDIGAAYVE